MARRHEAQAWDLGPGPRPRLPGGMATAIAANDNRQSGPSYASALPPDALAIVEPVPILAHQAGRVKTGGWRLRFAERWPPRADPLIGWTGGGDPLAQIELRFPDLDAAERYCRREGLPFEVRGSPAPRRACHGLNGDAPFRTLAAASAV